MTDISDAHSARTSLEGRRAIVTGGTTGIGHAVAVLLAAEGAHVYLAGTDQTILDDARALALARGREVGIGDVRVALVEPGFTGSDMQLPDLPPEQPRAMIGEEKMLRAEDIAVGVHYLLTQPRRAVIQRLTISPHVQDGD
ncbi:hypothetical protein K7957_04520 [Sphingomonas yunnanensis]|uniref:hypothetical protein n=1 Tax=Sphingomonas yunnanensis TaxID=310400 RepID=UPI001CA6F193|nr:hypothetical protein [Sphingomonas yunnanensis]MBY9062191.1 hypothetical protein [Sphingomonas yunnanensis]